MRNVNLQSWHAFAAEKLGLATSPPYLALPSSNANYVNGVNFASGGAGVSNATNKVPNNIFVTTFLGY